MKGFAIFAAAVVAYVAIGVWWTLNYECYCQQLSGPDMIPVLMWLPFILILGLGWLISLPMDWFADLINWIIKIL